MNVTSLINSIARELTKEANKEAERTGANFSIRDVENLFDRAALTVATREFDKFRREGAKKA